MSTEDMGGGITGDGLDTLLQLGAKTIEGLRDEILAANARERKAFIAGVQAVTESMPYTTVFDEDQAWQQYRCQDETDWKVVCEEDAAKIDAAVLGRQEQK